MARTRRQRLYDKLDKIVSEIIIFRYDNRCVMCGSTTSVGNGHVFSRTNLSLRWDIRVAGNCHAQCWKHNYLHSTRDSYPYYKWFRDKFGTKRFEELHTEWIGVTKLLMSDLDELYAKLKVERDRLIKVESNS